MIRFAAVLEVLSCLNTMSLLPTLAIVIRCPPRDDPLWAGGTRPVTLREASELIRTKAAPVGKA